MAAPERTSLAEIVDAGRELLETGGPAGLTMQAVARRVGVRAPSLYKRVRDREALLGLIAGATVDELSLRMAAADGTIAGIAHAYRAFAHERPEGFRLTMSTAADTESLARASVPILKAAEELVGPAEALEAARLVTAWVNGFVSMELAGAFRLGGDIERAFEFGLERLTVALTPQS
ncbi:TetR family transcriptional regulator [Aeromicrobium sp. Root236]|uniref:TetR/AcrR family transcriptional regulator n=1 Tax=Aeromicrobium sp. Root236 TaxID=1736498 RepID=UPI0006FC6537|nr:TetR/AcrR family transcriptional regulator [Aeromicrobium sp. Root236]KRC66249.1 TetR family transcriptional regulator [Aeromicrobium sp. Root236]